MKKLSVLFILSILVIVSACGGSNSSDSASGIVVHEEPTGDERELIILGSNFTFDQEEYHIATDEPIRLIYRNAEGDHAISVKRTNISLRHDQEAVITFTEPGSYDIICSVYCGAGHTNMTAKLIVE